MNPDNFLHLLKGLSTEEFENFRNRIHELLTKGQAEGKIFQTDIEEAIPYSVIDGEALNEIFNALEDEGIKVIRNEGTLVELLQICLTTDGYKWIRRSALTERAYWLGAHEALSITDNSDDQLKSVFSKVLGTIFHRNADNSFPKTTLGALFNELEDCLQDRKEKALDTNPVTEKIRHELDLLNHQFMAFLKQAVELSGEIDRIRKCETAEGFAYIESNSECKREIFEILGKLKERLQYLSLFQTNHDMQKRFD